VHRYGGHVLQLQPYALGQRDAELPQHAEEGLRSERRLRGLVSGAVEADDESVADQVVAAHTGERSEILQAFGLCRCAERERGEQ
jgi:hypothetical protein